jgi:hypothetical protein
MVACVDRPRMLLHNIHNRVCTRPYGVLAQTTLRILTTVSTSSPIPKIIKNRNVEGNITLGKLYFVWAVYHVHFHIFTITYIFLQLCTLFYIISQKIEETHHLQYIWIFYDQDQIWLISNFYHNYTARKHNFWSWNKTAYMRMKSQGRLFKKWGSLCYNNNLNDSHNIK